MKCFVLLLLIMPLLGSAQGVKRNQYDVFLKKQTVELEPVSLIADAANRLSVVFFSESPDLYVQVRGSGWGATTIDEGDELQFLFSNDSTVSVKSAGLQSFEPGPGRSTYRHQYRITQAAVQALSRFELVGLRKFSFKESSELRIPRDQRGKMQAAGALFLAELRKAEAAKPLKKIDAQDVLNFVGDSVQFCSRVYNVRRTTTAGNETFFLELQADFSSPIVQAVLSNTGLVGAEAGKQFLDKPLCVSGLLRMRNGLPTIDVRNAAQLQATSVESK